MAKLKSEPSYACKVLKPSNGTIRGEHKNEKCMGKTYTFDIIKCDEIFDVLASDAQIIVPQGPEKSTSRAETKTTFLQIYFLGHNTFQCVLFRYIMHKPLKDGRLQFGKRPKASTKVDTDPLLVGDANFIEPLEIMMVETTEGLEIYHGGKEQMVLGKKTKRFQRTQCLNI